MPCSFQYEVKIDYGRQTAINRKNETFSLFGHICPSSFFPNKKGSTSVPGAVNFTIK